MPSQPKSPDKPTPNPRGLKHESGEPVKVGLIIKRSAYDRAMDQPEDRLHGLMDKGDPTVALVKDAHDEHMTTAQEVKQALKEQNVVVTRIRRRRDPFDGTAFDLIITVGGDGTLLHATHSIGHTPLLGVNSAPSHSVGFFCGARQGSFAKALKGALSGRIVRASINRMEVELNEEVVHRRVLNDALFCHQSPAATSRYILEYENISEEQKSSGIWVGPAAGSTAAQRSAGGKVLPLGSKTIQLLVREPYTPYGNPYALNHVLAKPGQHLLIRSKSRSMRLFLDGHAMIRVNLGDRIAFRQSTEPLNLLGISVRRKWEKG